MAFECFSGLSKESVSRYARQIIVDEIGPAGQVGLLSSSLLIVGAGGLGCPVGLYAAAAGFGRIGIVDDDIVSVDNLHRQVAHTEDSVGSSKVLSLQRELIRLNSTVTVQVHCVRLVSSNALEIINQYDVVADCTDNVATRYLINDACVMAKKVLVSGSALRWEGQLSVYNFSAETPCYRCVFPVPPPAEGVSSCSESGVVGAVVGVIGCMQALECIKIAARKECSYAGRLFVFDGLRGLTRCVTLRSRNPRCAVCSDSPDISHLEDLPVSCSVSHDQPQRISVLEQNDRLTACEYSKLQPSSESAPILVDVRPEVEFNIVRLRGAIRIGMGEISKLSSCELRTRMNVDEDTLCRRGVCVICRRGNDSQLAVRTLREKFVELPSLKIQDIVDGYEGWQRDVDPALPIY